QRAPASTNRKSRHIMKTIDVDDVYELTPLQHGLLYHCLSAPAGGFYIEQMHFSVRGDLRVNCVRRAWERIITRHPALAYLLLLGRHQPTGPDRAP
ncbi:condensation domain-containing protein, partial [Salinispora arenicola]|uniref:condensation domain-containing protein n=1 Tax=Salinispora arenicola TaxID=168697 RepID=UPI0027DDF8B3